MRQDMMIDQISSNQNHSPIEHDSKVSYALVASGGLGGGYIPMIAYEDEDNAVSGNNKTASAERKPG